MESRVASVRVDYAYRALDHLRRQRDAQGDAGSKPKDLAGEAVHDETHFVVSMIPLLLVSSWFSIWLEMKKSQHEVLRRNFYRTLRRKELGASTCIVLYRCSRYQRSQLSCPVMPIGLSSNSNSFFW